MIQNWRKSSYIPPLHHDHSLEEHKADQIVQQIIGGDLTCMLGDNYHLSPSIYNAIQIVTFPFFSSEKWKGYHHTHARCFLFWSHLIDWSKIKEINDSVKDAEPIVSFMTKSAHLTDAFFFPQIEYV